MIFQTNANLPKPMQKYGCAFVSLAYYREKYQGKPWTWQALGAAWNAAINTGIVSGDANGDGDMDDPGEATILDWQNLVDFLSLKLRYHGKSDLNTHFNPEVYFLVTAWYNPRTKLTHFVAGDPVEFDPIEGGSVTVREGARKPLGADGSGGYRVFMRES